MASQITNYQCPNCSGPLQFVGESGKLECDYCKSSFEVAVIEQLYADKEQAAAAAKEPQWDFTKLGGSWTDEEAAHLRAYGCPSCGAQLVCDDNTAATSCPYCGNPTVVPSQYADKLKPNYVIPFKLNKAKAEEALKKHYHKKRFLPKGFNDANHIGEIQGIYVPFWLYDGESNATMRYSAKKVSSHTSGNYKITNTDHYRVAREGTVAFEKVPVDGASKMPDAHMDAIEPYDYSELKPFSSAYLPGFLAYRYDENVDTCSKRANRRIIESTERLFASTTRGYTSVTREYSSMELLHSEVSYALMPVWMLYTKWRGKDFLFAMNGQTGKLIGDLPVDKGRYWSWFARIYLTTAALLAIGLFILL